MSRLSLAFLVLLSGCASTPPATNTSFNQFFKQLEHQATQRG
jgi:hypothetical protein